MNGFHNLPVSETKKHRWFPVDASLTRAGMPVFLPEKELVLLIPGNDKNRFALDTLRDFLGFATTKAFKSDVLGPSYLFPNTLNEQIHRLSCYEAGMDYICMVTRLDNQVREVVTVPCTVIKSLIMDSIYFYNKQMEGLARGVKDIPKLTDEQLTAVLDSGMVDYYER